MTKQARIEQYSPNNPEVVGTFGSMIEHLTAIGYPVIQNIPLRKYPKTEHLEIYEREYAHQETCRLFQIAADPEDYREKALISDELATMYRLFFLNQPASIEAFSETVPKPLLEQAMALGIVAPHDNVHRCIFRFVPVVNTIYVTSAFDRSLPIFGYLSYDSLLFVDLVRSRLPEESPPRCILDYCCGSGYVGLALLRNEDTLLGVDISPEALWLAKLNAALQENPRTAFTCADHPPENETFDLIVCNPPFVHLRESSQDRKDSYGGGRFGLEKPLCFLNALRKALKPDGQGFIITATPVLEGEDCLLDVLEKEFGDVAGEYFDLCDAVNPVEEWQAAMGIELYKHILLSFSHNRAKTDQARGWTAHVVEGKERYRYAF